jgi:hypothetical protein
MFSIPTPSSHPPGSIGEPVIAHPHHGEARADTGDPGTPGY